MYTITWKNCKNEKQEIRIEDFTDACLIAAVIARNHNNVQIKDSNGNILAQ